jgi:putative endonuclease
VARHYSAAGATVAARRWRGTAGEIDLIVREGARVVFVEVKCSDTTAGAAQMLLPRQIARLFAAAQEFVAAEPAGQDTEMRFDVALVDAAGHIDVIRNALGA